MRICKIEDCDTQVEAKNYCKKHYTRFWKYGDPFHTERGIHGMFGTPEYITWANMIQRCCNKKHKAYKYYGRQGIAVCDRWLHSFVNFFNDMGPKPFSKAEIDRIDNDLGYFPENCRWVTSAQNNQNKRNIKLTLEKARAIREKYQNSGMTQKEIGNSFGVSPDTISLIVNQKTWKETK